MKDQRLLPTGAIVSVNDDRVRVDLPSSSKTKNTNSSYQSISSAILNGGCHNFSSTSSTSSPSTASRHHHVINYKVPSTYNGFDPSPLDLLSNFATKESIDPTQTIGLLTAANMKSMSISSRNAKNVNVDVIVTAGLSNSRCVGAEADYFVICDNNKDDDTSSNINDEETSPPRGTINTIIIIDTPLTQAAQVEAYAIAIESKCSACIDHGIMCSKESNKFAMGTGTDCCVLLSPCSSTDQAGGRVIKHAGKHTLLAELIGQAVNEATSNSIMINIKHLHGSYMRYTIHRWLHILLTTLKGARPCIPPAPMMPIPSASRLIVSMGVFLVLCIYIIPTSIINDKVKLLLGAVIWDRYLGEPWLKVHPVCLAGSAITMCLSHTSDRVYNNAVLGFTCGLALLMSTLLVFMSGAWIFLQFNDGIAAHGPALLFGSDYFCNINSEHPLKMAFDLIAWLLKLLLLKSTFSLQLLCTIALQMAKFLERDQINKARMQLSWLCSRDPSKLNSSDLAGATLESLSENLSDGFIAPLFWYVLLGPVGALGYRIVNTLDSRIGYRGKYEWYGKSSARLDDLINIIPARLTALLLALAAIVVNKDVRSAHRGLHVAWKDHKQCESPNAGWPMAMFAGLLGVNLQKKGDYCLNTKGMSPRATNVRVGHQMATVAGGLAVLLATFAIWISMN